MKYSRTVIGCSLVFALLGLTACQAGPMMTDEAYKAQQRYTHYLMASTLSSMNEVPAVASAGSGSIELALNRQTNVLTWTVAYQGLSSPVTAAHFHGPAVAGQNANVTIPMLGNLTSPFVGAVILSPGQVVDLTAGNWYVNVHTTSYPNGEIRGQIAPMP